MVTTFRDKPYYDSTSISSLQALSSILDVHHNVLVDISNHTKHHYHSFEYTTNNGKVRQLNDPKFHLKKIQKRINSRIFSNVLFPPYLHGGIKGRDYYSNAASHSNAEFVFSFDIRNFYDNITKKRLGHSQSFSLRHRLEKIFPAVSEETRKNLYREVTELEKLPAKSLKRFKYIKKINKSVYFCGILSRTHKKEAIQLRKRLAKISFLKSYDQFWEE